LYDGNRDGTGKVQVLKGYVERQWVTGSRAWEIVRDPTKSWGRQWNNDSELDLGIKLLYSILQEYNLGLCFCTTFHYLIWDINLSLITALLNAMPLTGLS